MRRILVIDGDNISLRAMQNVLQRAQYDVQCSQSGRLGLVIAAEFDPDVVLVDLDVEDMSGLEVLRELRRIGSRSPRILITRFGHDEDRLEAMQLGASDCIEQPLSSELLLAVVHNAESGSTQTNPLEDSHALARWADVVVRGVRSPRDMPTLEEWGRTVGVSKGGIRNWCYAAHLSPKRSLQFMRVLRAVIRQRASSRAPEDLLNIVDRRTLAKLLTLAGGTPTALPRDLTHFLEHQQIIENGKAIAVVRAALRLEGSAETQNNVVA